MIGADTDENRALHDKFGLPLLPDQLREEIGKITRAELKDASSFEVRYGEPLARTFLSENRIPAAPDIESCVYSWEASRGSLIKGDEVTCGVALQLPKGNQGLGVQLTKRGFEWRIVRSIPTITEIQW